jgi:murein DD-endopeptidase MepM/ murein hydrolase activator NlpD
VTWTGWRLAVPALVAAGSIAAASFLGDASAAGAPGVAAAPADDPLRDKKNRVDDEIAEVRETLEGASKDVVAAAVAVQVAKRRLTAARLASRAAQQALALAVTRDREVAADLAVAQAQQAKAERELVAGQVLQQQTRSRLGRMARDTYMGSGVSGLAVALGADSPDEFADRVALAGLALRSQGGIVDELAVQQAELTARSTKVQAVAQQVAELKRQSAAAVAARRAAERAAAAAAARTAALLAAQQAALRVARTKVAGEQARLRGLRNEQAKLQAMLAARARAAAEARRRRPQPGGGGGLGAPTGGGGLSYPARGPITSPYGQRYHPILNFWRLHSGIDFGLPCGTPVYASAAGVVVSAGSAGGYGNRVVIDHGLVRGVGLATTYNHLTSIAVGGGRVKRGQLIGISGTTGLSTGCHLHFETLANGNFVDPMNWL